MWGEVSFASSFYIFLIYMYMYAYIEASLTLPLLPPNPTQPSIPSSLPLHAHPKADTYSTPSVGGWKRRQNGGYRTPGLFNRSDLHTPLLSDDTTTGFGSSLLYTGTPRGGFGLPRVRVGDPTQSGGEDSTDLEGGMSQMRVMVDASKTENVRDWIERIPSSKC